MTREGSGSCQVRWQRRHWHDSDVADRACTTTASGPGQRPQAGGGIRSGPRRSRFGATAGRRSTFEVSLLYPSIIGGSLTAGARHGVVARSAVTAATLATFGGRCVLAGGVAPPSNTPGILGRRPGRPGASPVSVRRPGFTTGGCPGSVPAWLQNARAREVGLSRRNGRVGTRPRPARVETPGPTTRTAGAGPRPRWTVAGSVLCGRHLSRRGPSNSAFSGAGMRLAT